MKMEKIERIERFLEGKFVRSEIVKCDYAFSVMIMLLYLMLIQELITISKMEMISEM